MVGTRPTLLVAAARAAQSRLGSSFRWLCSMSRRMIGLAVSCKSSQSSAKNGKSIYKPRSAISALRRWWPMSWSASTASSAQTPCGQ